MISKIYLVYMPNSSKKDYEEYIFPNGVLYIYAALKKNKINADLVMLTADEYEYFVSEIEEDSIVGFSVNSSNRLVSLETASKLKKEKPEVKIIMGGPFISLMEDDVLENIIDVDFFFKGESEVELVRFIQEEKYNSREKIICSERIEDLDTLDYPAKHDVVYSNIITSRGCPGNCIYCSSPALWKRKLYFRSAEDVMEELELLYNQGVDYFIFSDDTFSADKERIIKLCDLIIESGINIIFDARSRTDFMTDKIIKKLAKAGCVSISFGIESASEKVSDILSKNINITKAENVIKVCNRYGIKTNLFFITGNPEETEEDIKNNIDFIKSVKADWITVYGLHYYPGTELERKYSKKINWFKDVGTVYFEKNKVIDRNIALMERAQRKSGKKIKIDELLKKFPHEYPLKFWMYDMLGDNAKSNKDKLKFYKKSLQKYESPETLYKLGLLEKKYLEKARDKFAFQLENDIRKSPAFLKSAIQCFQHLGERELADYAYAELLLVSEE